jgi:hypothetical protein
MRSSLDVAEVPVVTKVVTASVDPFGGLTISRAIVWSSGTESGSPREEKQESEDQHEKGNPKDVIGS